MPSTREIALGIRELSTSTHLAACVALIGVERSQYQVIAQYAGSFLLCMNNGTPVFSYKFSSSSFSANDVKVVINLPNSANTIVKEIMVLDADTPAVFLKRAFEDLKLAFRAEPGEGEVKAYHGASKFFWSCLPVGSPEMAVYNGVTYDAEKSGMFLRMFTSETEYKWFHPNEAGDYVSYNGNYYTRECTVPIYHNAIPFNVVHTNCPSWVAETMYQTVMVDNELRYIDLERPLASFFARGIHSYSTRIETVVPEEMLFLKGKTDLYSHRDNDETPFLGWELEACTDESVAGTENTAKEMKARLPFLVMAKSDSSIRPEGFETVSVPATLDFWKESDLADTLDSMRAAPYKMRSFKHASCGFHVHVSRSALSLLDLQKLERFMHNPANRTQLEALAGRGSNNYQNYKDDMFSNRKSLKVSNSAARRSREYTHIDGIDYCDTGTQRNFPVREQTTLAQAQRFYSNSTLYGLLYSLWGDTVLYDSLNQVTDYQFDRTGRVFSSDGVSPTSYSDAQKALLIRLCNASPFFRWKYDSFFDSIRDELPAITYVPNAPAPAVSVPGGLMRTKLPIGRKNSYEAAQRIEGATGKGRERYDVLNTSNRSTVEFRLFKGTMNPTTVFRYLELVDAIVRFVASTCASDAGVSFDAFVKWVMGDAFHVSRYENLVAFFVEHKMYKREEIKRRTLPTLVADDGDLNVVAKPKPVTDKPDNKPLYSINTLNPVAVPEGLTPPSVNLDEMDEPEWEDTDNYDNYEEDVCECDDCRRARGED